MNLIVLGPPGAGKGTQSKILAAELKLKHISTGDILREAIKNNTALGLQAKRYVESGGLVPDALVTEMVIERISRADAKNGFILDGFPRNIQQAEALDDFLNAGSSVAKVIYLDASEKVIIQRLGGRRVCPKCQAVFHIKNMPPKKDMLCDFCATALIRRPDDEEATIKNRLQVYNQQTAPLIDYYLKQNTLTRIPADEEAGAVIRKMLEVLEK